MGSFFSLFRGETKKIWSKKSAWVMIVILSGIMALMALLFGAMGSLGEDVVRSFNQSSLVGQLNSLTGMEITGDLYLEQAEENLPALKEQVEQAREEMEASTGIERYANFIAYNSLDREYQVTAYQVEHQIAPERMAASWGRHNKAFISPALPEMENPAGQIFSHPWLWYRIAGYWICSQSLVGRNPLRF